MHQTLLEHYVRQDMKSFGVLELKMIEHSSPGPAVPLLLLLNRKDRQFLVRPLSPCFNLTH